MRTYDFSPLFRSTIGFDRWSDLFDAAMRNGETAASYPPYNIEKTGDDSYRITMAVAGFGEGDLELTVQDNVLTVAGKGNEGKEQSAAYLYRGIATRAFERRFSLADHVQVAGAALENGMLRIDLVREVPEAMKPRKIAINAPSAKVIEGKKAA